MEFDSKIANFLFSFKREVDEGDNERLKDMYKRILIIAWPSALEGIMMTLMNSFDTMMVGRLGSNAIASVGLCAQPRMILLLIAQSLCMGTTAVVARRKGEGNQKAAISTLQQSLALILIVGVVMTVFGMFLGAPLLKLAGAKEGETLEDAIIYFRYISMAFIFNYISLCICAAMRGIGKTRITMVVHMIANVVNVFLNYCLIFGHFGFPALGIKGAAIATAIGGVVSAGAAVAAVLRKKDNFLCLLPWQKFRFDKDTLRGLVKVGSGTIAESVFMRVGFLLNGKLIAGVSTAAYATNQIVQQVSGLTFCLGDGIGAACTSMVGQSMGAGQKKKAYAYAKLGQRICLYVSIFLIIFIFTGRNWMPRLFNDEPQILYASALCFIVCLVGVYPQNMRVMISGCLRGAGDVRYVALVSLISVAILRPLATWFFCYPMNRWFPGMMFGFIGAWISFDVDSVVRWLLLQVRINKGEWVNIKL